MANWRTTDKTLALPICACVLLGAMSRALNVPTANPSLSGRVTDSAGPTEGAPTSELLTWTNHLLGRQSQLEVACHPFLESDEKIDL
jgi:hypothetical protein